MHLEYTLSIFDQWSAVHPRMLVNTSRIYKSLENVAQKCFEKFIFSSNDFKGNQEESMIESNPYTLLVLILKIYVNLSHEKDAIDTNAFNPSLITSICQTLFIRNNMLEFSTDDTLNNSKILDLQLLVIGVLMNLIDHDSRHLQQIHSYSLEFLGKLRECFALANDIPETKVLCLYLCLLLSALHKRTKVKGITAYTSQMVTCMQEFLDFGQRECGQTGKDAMLLDSLNEAIKMFIVY